MLFILELVLIGAGIYALGRLERKRRMLHFRNVRKIFLNENNEIAINEKTKIVLSEPVPYADTMKYDLHVVFEKVTVETLSLTEKLVNDEPISFKGPWKRDIYKVLRNKYMYYTERSRNRNIVQMKSKKELYVDRYKDYIAQRAYK